MNVFVTGATGFVGSAVVAELLKAGHEVTGLARSDANAASLAAAGAKVHRGDLTDLASLKSGAAASEAVIHTGFVHDFSRFKEVCEIDHHAIDALASALAGSNRPLIVSSGTALLTPGRISVEEDVRPPGASAVPRVSEERAAAAAEKGVRASAVRLPPTVHGAGDHGFIGILINLAREKGFSAYVGEGNNRWPAVHRLDAGLLYRLALEKGTMPRYHAIAEEGVPFREIATVIGRRLNMPVKSIAPEEAATHFGWFAHFAAVDCPASSAQTRKQLGWHPTHTTLIKDIDSDAYFTS
jgi:nucleoside-diphosphate-sugar epimerase